MKGPQNQVFLTHTQENRTIRLDRQKTRLGTNYHTNIICYCQKGACFIVKPSAH